MTNRSKIAFLGGIKSGKSRLAEAYIQKLSPNQKPYYLATTECLDLGGCPRIFLR